MAVELATAYVSIVPSTRGIGSQLRNQMAGPAAAAGTAAGTRMGGAMSGALGKTVKIGGAAMVAGIGAAAVSGVTQFAQLERGMNEVFTLLPGISQAAMDDMTGQVKTFATEFGTLPSDVVPALYQSLSAGVPPGNVFDFLETAQKAAIGGVTDLTTAVDGISSVVNAYGDQIGGAGEASDLMFTAVRLGKTTMGELASSLSNVTPIAAANNVAFSDVTAALATMTAQGIPTAQATTQIRQAIVELSDSGSEVGKAFEKVAGTSFRTFMEEGGSVGDALGILEGHADKSGVTIDQLFGSVEAGGAALALTGQNADSFASNIDAMAESAGATDAAYAQMDQGIGRSFDRIKASGAVALTNIGDALSPLVSSMAGWAEDTLPRVAEQVGPALAGAFDAVSGAAGRVAAAVGGFVDGALAGLSAWWSNNGPTIVDSASTIAEVVQGSLVAAFEAVSRWWETNGPAVMSAVQTLAGAVVGAFAGLAASAAFVQRNWSAIRPVVMTVGGIIVGLLIPHYIALGVAAVRAAVLNARAWLVQSTAALRHGASIITSIVTVVARWVWMGVQSLVHAARVGGAWALTAGAAAASAVASMATTAGQMIAHWVRMAVQSLVQAGRMAVSWVIAMGPVGWVIAAVVALVALVVANWDRVSSATSKAWSAVSSAVSRAASAVTSAVSRMRDRAVAAVSALRDRAVAAFSALRDRAVAAASALRDRVVSAVSALRDRAVAAVSALRDRAVAAVTGMRDRAVAAVTALRDRFLSGVQRIRDGAVQRFESLRTWVAGLPGRLSAAVGNLGSLLYSKGADLIRGLWDGIKSMGEWLFGRITSFVADNIPAPVARALGISSPSKVMADQARDIPRGMAVGIAAETATVAAAADDMARAAIPDLAVPGVPALSRAPAVVAAVRGSDGATVDYRALAAAIGDEMDARRLGPPDIARLNQAGSRDLARRGRRP